MKKIRSVLIANRGEIACRIIRTCQRLGITSYAVYSEADKGSLHTKMADVAIPLQGFESSESYLRIDKIVATARGHQIDAVHPGYGFLSENPIFVKALLKAGIKFIGPSAKTMLALGDKIHAKKLAARCNVPTVSSVLLGSSNPVKNRKLIATFGQKVGYPLIVKAAAGGGGRGMRRIDSEKEISEALLTAAREAKSFFGDPRVFVEKLLVGPRHVEVQFIGDSHGRVTHLFNRDCTMQRRHQKLIEEAPAPGIPSRVQVAMFQATERLARAAHYENAGTAEFLVDDDFNFYFLEVNSRLQVEHPVTEAITGLDLVELQVRIAEGAKLISILKPLPPRARRRVAIEARICAESPEHQFSPSTGRIELITFPADKDIRIECGVTGGDTISHYYDPLLAKVIASGTTRKRAIAALRSALKSTAILGIQSNIGYLIKLLDSKEFTASRYHIKSAEEILLPTGDILPTIAALACISRFYPNISNDPWATLGSFRLGCNSKRVDILEIRKTRFTVTCSSLPEGISCDVQREDRHFTFSATLKRQTGPLCTLILNSKVISFFRHDLGARTWITLQGESFEVAYAMSSRTRVKKASSGVLCSPLPGKILDIKVKIGEAVVEGAPLIVLESMKMEHAVVAPFNGKIKSISSQQGAVVDAGTVLIEITH